MLVTLLRKVKLLAGGSYHFHISGTGDGDIDITYPVFSSKDSGRNDHLLSYTDHTRQSAQQHDRLTYEYAFVGMPVSLTVSGYDHYFDTSVIIRHRIDMTLLLSLPQQERAFELHHRFETVDDGFRPFVQGIVATDTEQLLDASAVSTDYIVIHIPGTYAQCFTGIKGFPGFGGTEAGKVEQAFIDDSQRISHFATVLFRNDHFVFGFRLDLVRHTDLWIQMAFRRSYRERYNTVHTDRQVVLCKPVRLQQRDVDVCIRLHLFSYIQLDRCLLVVAGMFGNG